MSVKTPKGKLLIIGGAESKGETQDVEIIDENRDFKPLEILDKLIDGNGKRAVEIITTASLEPQEVVKTYKKAFRKVDFCDIDFMSIADAKQAADEAYVERIKKAHAVFFTGGDQFRLATILGNTPVIDIIKERYHNDSRFIVAGTSAGAMAIASLMICEGETYEAVLGGDIRISSGLGLISSCIVDTHFVKRGRFGRLAHAVIMNPECIGIGIGEDTALLVSKGNEAKCYGSGMAIVIDGQYVGHTNIAYLKEGSPLNIEGLNVHLLSNGTRFLLRERKFVPSVEDIREKKKSMLKKS